MASPAVSRFRTLGAARQAQRRSVCGPRADSTGDRENQAARALEPLGNTYEQVSATTEREPGQKTAAKPLRWGYQRPKVLPLYVRRCGCDALYTWAKADPSRVSRRPLLCGSWRHEGSCARHSASVAFARMKAAFAPLDPTGNVFMVLTLDQNGVYSEKRWANADEANAALSKQSRNFLKRLRRYCKAQGWQDFGSKWVATVESHRTGWPHMNFVIHAPELARALAADYAKRLRPCACEGPRHRKGCSSHRSASLLDGELLTIAMSTGWGAQSVAERGADVDALASYIAKLAGTADATMGELAKLSQSPVAARKGFRRLRAGVGFLPPKKKNEEYTGTLIRRLPDATRTAYAAIPLVKLKCPVARAVSVALLEVEEARMSREWRWRSVPLAMNEQRPPLPTRETYEFRDGRFVLLAGLAPLRNGEVPALAAKPDANRSRFVLAPDPSPAPDPLAPHVEEVQRREHVQLSIRYGEPVFELGSVDPDVNAERARGVSIRL